MVHIRFTSLLLLGLFCVMHAIIDSPAHAHQGGGANGEGLVVKGENVVIAQKGFLDGITGLDTREIGLGGRKMAIPSALLKKEMEKYQQRVKGRTTKISGEDHSDDDSKNSLGEPQDQLNDQSKSNKLEQKTWKTSSLGNPRNEPAVHLPKSTKPMHSQVSKKVTTKASSLDYPSRNPKQISQKRHDDDTSLKDEAKEIVNLMHKDYADMGRRSPPVNNDVPRLNIRPH
ncbi:hypothetical protein CFOL_v3_03625 [Cephalotus follicularis]|uniref:Uncharacterized protein n=1 Tax=Cephalotus follicularis TaxID=3775 RepID=A0A1Q3AWR6_CEPFO|nr:hypothetical protein CFOL_v3_03625 [Cephalotus follicularis]